MFIKQKILIRKVKGHFFALFRLLLQPEVINNNGVLIDVSNDYLAKYKKSFYKNTWELIEFSILKEVLVKDDKVLEIGSGTSYLTIWMAKYLGENNVFAIEANPEMMNIAFHHAEINKVSFPIKNYILGDLREYTFYISDNLLSSSLNKKNNSKAIKVQGYSFESIIYNFKPNVLFVDIEGGGI